MPKIALWTGLKPLLNLQFDHAMSTRYCCNLKLTGLPTHPLTYTPPSSRLLQSIMAVPDL